MTILAGCVQNKRARPVAKWIVGAKADRRAARLARVIIARPYIGCALCGATQYLHSGIAKGEVNA
jgi:hypothetical protein